MNQVSPSSDVGDEKREGADPGVILPADNAAGTTIGTGSALGIGCVIAVVIFVLVAFAARWLAGIW
jgi:hypothetical protein